MSEIVIKTFEKELFADGVNALTPLKRIDAINGVAHPDEVNRVVLNRSGSVLSASTILKSDFFSNLQKMTLPEFVPLLVLDNSLTYFTRRIEGSPNFRRIPLTLRLVGLRSGTPAGEADFEVDASPNARMVCGR